MKKTRRKAPPRFGRASNKQKLKYLSNMVYMLSAITPIKYADVARKLERMGDTLSLNAETASRKANIQALTSAFFEDFTYLRDSIMEGSAIKIVDSSFEALSADVTAMYKFLDNNITASPLDDFTNHRVAKFISKKEEVKSIFRMADKSLSLAQKKKEGLSTDVESVVTQRRVAMRMQQLESTIATQTDAVVTLSSIIDKLELLTNYAKLSPKLAKEINRKIKLKPLGDIFYQPVKSKIERDKLNSELFYIIKNVTQSLNEEVAWSDTLYGRTSEGEVEQVNSNQKTENVNIPKPQKSSEKEVKSTNKIINPLEGISNV